MKTWMNFRAIAKELKIKEPVLKKVLVEAGVINSRRDINPKAMEAGLAKYKDYKNINLPSTIQVPFYDIEYVKELLAGTGVTFIKVEESPTGGYAEGDAPL